jgi:DNA-binding winged helix-turn-helix (wHTH) protein/tetratricopeptide (TPR) repeat protein
MREEQIFLFDSFRFDPANASLRRGKHDVFLTPKAFSMLRYLVEHTGQLVTKDDLWQAAWPGITVTDAALTVCMSEIRKALGDNAKTPRYVETVHRRGYRFIASVTTQTGRYSPPGVWGRGFTPDASLKAPIQSLAGREEELAQLHKWLGKALNAERQIVFVTGEPGIGKTTLVQTFLQQVAAEGNLWIGRGQCIEHYGAGEAYLPVLDALGRLCRESRGERLIELLDQYAPTWLVQMPGLLSATELELLQRKVAGVTRERMLRELAEAMEVITREWPLVLRLEDLHWSDYSTLEWLAFLGRRQEPARLLVLATYRPVEVILREHPLKTVKQELQVHGQCNELPLGLLSETAVAEYLEARFASPSRLAQGERRDESLSQPLRKLTRVIHQRTDGNPLFMVNIVDYLIAQGAIVPADGQWKLRRDLGEVEGEIPESLRQMIERHVERVSSIDRQVLEVASVAGTEFSVAAVAAGLETTVAEVEQRCEALARSEHLLRASGVSEWPDGTVAARYAFIHSLYQEVVYERVTPGRRIDVHRNVAEWEERAYGDRAGEIATELAVHFERARDYRRAVQYRQRAGDNAVRLSAHQGAISHVTKGLELLTTLPDTPDRAQQELALQMTLGTSLLATRGFGSSEVGQAYTRAHELCRRLGETPQLFPVLAGLRFFYVAQGNLEAARGLGEQLLQLAESIGDPALILEGHYALAVPLHLLGEFVPALEHCKLAIALYDPQLRRSHAFLYGLDAGVASRCLAAWLLWELGYPDRSLEKSREAMSLASEVAHPISLANALASAGLTQMWCGETQPALALAEALIALAREKEFSAFLAMGILFHGWALTAQGKEKEGVAQILEGIAGWRATGARGNGTGHLAVLLAAYLKRGDTEEAMPVLSEALAMVQNIGERNNEARLYQLKGELLRARGADSDPEAERSFRTAIRIAQCQHARSLELRAVMSLARLLDARGRRAEARAMLAEIYGWFTEGFDTADLKDAKALLDDLNE